MKRTKLGIGLLLMLALVVTSGTFAYWASGLAAPTDDSTVGTVTIGAGAAKSSTITLAAVTPTGSALVPSGYGGDVATFTIPTSWDQDSGTEFAGAAGTLVVTVTYSMSGSGSIYSTAQLDAMFSYTVTGDGAITEGAAPQSVVVTVTFDTEPADATIYGNVTGETLTATINFSITVD